MNGIGRVRALVLCGILLLLSHEAVFSQEQFLIASFSTSVQDQDESVKQNMLLGCMKINGSRIAHGSIFSFNDVVGEGSAKNGYVMGRVLYRDEVRFEPGGGLCQLSSTVFNALLLAGFTIIERHRHYQPVTYVPYGLDATIKYGKKNLRMKNVSGQTVRIEATINDKTLTVKILGYRPLDCRYEVYTEVEDIEIPFQEDRDRIRNGISVYVYRRKFSGQKLLESFLLYKDFYPAVYIR